MIPGVSSGGGDISADSAGRAESGSGDISGDNYFGGGSGGVPPGFFEDSHLVKRAIGGGGIKFEADGSTGTLLLIGAVVVVGVLLTTLARRK